MEPVILSIALIILVLLFVTEKIHYDIAGLLVVLLLVVLTELNIGLHFLTTYEALGGFAQRKSGRNSSLLPDWNRTRLPQQSARLPHTAASLSSRRVRKEE